MLGINSTSQARRGRKDAVAPLSLAEAEEGADSLEPKSFVTQDPATLATLELARSVAESDASILIEGESGTGKELLAQLIHRNSRRSRRELVCINCAALPAGLLESELFGHEKGAFTGAIARVIGKFEFAHGTTILLDEIAELELPLQAKLLRVLQEKRIERLGASRSVSVDFRLIATTNRKLHSEVAAGRFREDLFYRVQVLPLRLRPLRARPGDVDLLSELFLAQHRRRGRTPPRFTTEALSTLRRHAWPGNVRELENLIERVVLMRPGQTIEARELSRELSNGSIQETGSRIAETAGGGPDSGSLREMERWLITRTLRRLRGNRTRAAQELGISLRTLRNKVHEHEIRDPDTLPRTGVSRDRQPRASARLPDSAPSPEKELG